jgi:hypothetical protein
MFRRFPHLLSAALALLLLSPSASRAQQQALDSITAGELKLHLSFIASDALMGRDTPSPGLNAAAAYFASRLESYGLKPMMPGGSFLQTIPMERVSVSGASTLRVGDRSFRFPADFGVSGATAVSVSGDLVLVGMGLSAPDQGWDDYAGLDLQGKVVVLLNGELPADHPLARSQQGRRGMGGAARAMTPARQGAVAVLSVISPAEEARMAAAGASFPSPESVTWPAREGQQARPAGAGGFGGGGVPMLSLRQATATAVLGIPKTELDAMFAQLARGERVPGRALTGRRAQIDLKSVSAPEYTQNVVALIEGSDPVLKNEYIVIGGHYDHIGIRHGAYPDSICNGADDNGSGAVALLEIAQALTINHPKRSVIVAWWAGEEKGLRGSAYFVDHCPVPLEQIDAMLQMDMISRNDPASICLIGSHFLSSELDAAHRRVADRLGFIKIDDKYNDPTMQRNYHAQSDHYSFHSYSIPATFFFSDITDELHTPADEIALCNFDKMERVVKFVYASAIELGNMPAMVKLDRNPEITQRGQRIGRGR